jgi:serine/threonine protein kinase
VPTSKVCVQCGAEFGADQRFCPNDGSPLRFAGETDALIGQILAERYQILSVLGEGGMGRVYLAEHVRMGRKSAVKVMSPNIALAPEAISRFHREAANASRINHPNVAQVYDFGETPDGLLYLAMEFVEGETLRRLLDRTGPLPVVRAAEITRQIAEALGAAHHLDIVHRDLKPDNVMLGRYHDGSDLVKVVDFGIAKTVHGSGGDASQTVTTAGVSLGTPEYMSPEQLAGERLDGRTDIYSLGLLLFAMLTGDAPYPRVTSRETLVRRLTSKPLTLREVAPHKPWSDALQAALDHALAPEVADRYASAAEFARDVVATASNMDAGQATTVLLREPVGRPASAASTRRIDAAARTTAAPKRGHGRAVATAAGLVLAIAFAGAYALTHPKLVADASSITPRPQPQPSDSTATASHHTMRPPPPTPAVEQAGRTDRSADSASATAKADSVEDPNSMHTLARNIETHLQRARKSIARGDVEPARAELRELGPIVSELRRRYGGLQSEERVEQMMRGGGMQMLRACQSALASSETADRFPANFRCEQLIPQSVRGQSRYGRRRDGGGPVYRQP